uniref:SFRICE_017635 n=1 Tax=Spodoptera frugiperda TaxID=7108 RepID=A0A2H1W2A9_SPOFR
MMKASNKSHIRLVNENRLALIL